MIYRGFLYVFLVALMVTSAGCSRPETPQQVATGFWQALAEDNASDVVDLSTLADASGLEGLQDAGIHSLPDFGRVVIEANKATVETVLTINSSADDAPASTRREITTFLVQVNDQWLVDYQRTREALADRSSFSGLKENLGHLRQQFDDAVGRSSEQIADQVDQLAKDFKTYSEETGKKAEQALENFGESLEEFRTELEKSLDEARKNPGEPEGQEPGSLEQTAI